MRLRFLEHDGMTLLKDFVDGDERLERLYLVGENWLPVLAFSPGGGSRIVMAHSKQAGS